jgi:hypothetical protein
MLCFFKGYSQQYEINLSPEGKLETVYDNRGNLLKLKDILIDAPKEIGYLKTTNVTCSTTSYFNLYFEPGCGMDDTSNPTNNARRAVMCKVFEDISNFITSPLSTTGNKVNIWVRNIANENVLGELVYEQLLTPQTQNQINLSHLANGCYFARLENQANSVTLKLIKN